jgi:leader peptidase (prepilin peptidase) / N-methyltransferase
VANRSPTVSHRATLYFCVIEPLSFLCHSRNVTIAALFLFGLIVGSFLNVCITRIPEGTSIVSPRSRCPHCASRIKPYDNVPVVSWLVLGGKCRNCQAPISPMYPTVELLTALLFVACYLCFGLSLPALKWAFFICILVVLVVTDFRERILPDVVNWFGVGLGLVFAAYVPPVDGIAALFLRRYIDLPRWTSGVLDALLGAIFCAGLLWFTAWLYKVVRHRDGMGFGDVKMMFMVGTFFGLRGAFLTILLGTFLGTVVGLAVIGVLFASGWKKSLAERASKMGLGGVSSIRWAIASRYQLPLGSFLGIAALLVTFFSPWTLSRCAIFFG